VHVGLDAGGGPPDRQELHFQLLERVDRGLGLGSVWTPVPALVPDFGALPKAFKTLTAPLTLFRHFDPGDLVKLVGLLWG
jgi:hypothetical protein